MTQSRRCLASQRTPDTKPLVLADTQVVALSPTVALVCYEKQGAGSGGFSGKPPPSCKPAFSSIFCMRVEV